MTAPGGIKGGARLWRYRKTKHGTFFPVLSGCAWRLLLPAVFALSPITSLISALAVCLLVCCLLYAFSRAEGADKTTAFMRARERGLGNRISQRW